MLKRTALVLTLAAALVAVAPTAPAAADNGAGGPAWGRMMDSYAMSIVSTMACGLAPLALGISGAGGVVFGIACGITAAS